MNIIIIGAGDIGYHLAKMLSYEKHDIMLIEKEQDRYTRASETLDARVIHGSGTSFTLLESAGVEKADLVVAVTDSDETNLLAAIAAKQYGVERTVARVKNREFLRTDAPINAQKFNIDLIIHPESVAAQGAVRLLRQGAATDFIEFAKGKIIVMGIQLDRDNPILNIPLSELSKRYPEFIFRVIAIHRKDTTKIPRGNDFLIHNDRIFVIVARENVQDVVRITGKEDVKIEDVMILGGGQTGYIIAHELEKEYNVKIIESNVEKSYDLAEKLKRALVIKGDGLDLDLLAMEGIVDMDAFIAVTGDDETNIVSCLMAKHLKVPRIIALINRTDYWSIIPTIGINAYVSKQLLTVNSILKFIRRGAIVNVASIPGIAAEVIELIPKKASKITRKPLREIGFPSSAIVGAVMRDDQVFIPVGDTQVKAGDKVVLVSLPADIHEVEEFFN
ncbi:MAG: Trk system potassium transporter TrkA [bacterium]|nr:Trk system potassium transporter TrkA [bacterium]